MIEFYNNDVHISENGVDLLRYHFAYQHIDFLDMRAIKIWNGYLLQNRWLILVLGVAFVFFSLTIMIPGLAALSDFSTSLASFSSEAVAMKLFVPLLLISSGIYVIVLSMKRSKILSIFTESGHYDIRIKEFEKPGRIKSLIALLNAKVPKKVEIVD